MGKFLIFCRIQLKFRSWLYKYRWHTSWKFQFEKTSIKKVIAKKPLTNLYEINSTSYVSVNKSHDHSLVISWQALCCLCCTNDTLAWLMLHSNQWKALIISAQEVSWVHEAPSWILMMSANFIYCVLPASCLPWLTRLVKVSLTQL